MNTDAQKPFLKAEWRNLLVLNFEANPGVLRPLVPTGTELATFEGRCFVSLVAFQFLRTRVLGLPIPFHRNFEEINLRFYVRRTVGNETRRGVVFIKEFVPKRAIAWVARTLYNENYHAVPTGHLIDRTANDLPARVEYRWGHHSDLSRVSARITGFSREIAEGSAEQFFADHEWGYVRDRIGNTTEYRVVHPRWNVWTPIDVTLHCHAATVYGPGFADSLAQPPHSGLFADGSDVAVYRAASITR